MDRYDLSWILACKEKEINGGSLMDLQDKYLKESKKTLKQMVQDLNLTQTQMDEYLQDNRS